MRPPWMTDLVISLLETTKPGYYDPNNTEVTFAERLLILADALEEAGYPNQRHLDHMRDDTPAHQGMGGYRAFCHVTDQLIDEVWQEIVGGSHDNPTPGATVQ
jgi:hypothetical protein